MKEDTKWKDLKGYEGIYIISEKGQIVKLPSIQNKYGLTINPRIDASGYYAVGLKKDKKQCIKRIHRLLMETYKPVEGMEKLQVNHINGNKLDNRFGNLEWVTQAENVQHAFKTKLIKTSKRVIRNDGKIYESLDEAANDINSCSANIWNNIVGRTKQHRGYTFKYIDGEIMLTVEVIPYKTFRERLRLVKSIEKGRGTHIEVYSTYIYIERGGTEDERI